MRLVEPAIALCRHRPPPPPPEGNACFWPPWGIAATSTFPGYDVSRKCLLHAAHNRARPKIQIAGRPLGLEIVPNQLNTVGSGGSPPFRETRSMVQQAVVSKMLSPEVNLEARIPLALPPEPAFLP